MSCVNDCLFCGETKSFAVVTKMTPKGETNFMECQSCYSSSPIMHWQNPVSQSQTCLICASGESE